MFKFKTFNKKDDLPCTGADRINQSRSRLDRLHSTGINQNLHQRPSESGYESTCKILRLTGNLYIAANYRCLPVGSISKILTRHDLFLCSA